jgi:hypothetical protein
MVDEGSICGSHGICDAAGACKVGLEYSIRGYKNTDAYRLGQSMWSVVQAACFAANE